MFKASKSSRYLTAEVHVAKADWRGQNGEEWLDRLEYAVLITGADGIWFDQPHLGFSRYGMALIPQDNTTELLSIVVRGGYLDTCTENCLYVAQPSTSYNADFGLHSLDFASIYNSGKDAAVWYLTTAKPNKLWSSIGLGTVLGAGFNGLNVGLGEKLNILPGFSIMGPGAKALPGCGTTGTCNGIVLQGAVSDINIGRGVIEKLGSTNVNCGLLTSSGVDKWTVDMLRVRSMAFAICDNSATSDKSVATPLSW